MREGRLKQVAFAALELGGVLALAQRLARGVPILAYHGVTARASDDPGNRRRLHVPRAEFERHLELLTARYRPIPLSGLLPALKGGERLPERAVVITFDDGYRNFATQAWPSLRRFGVPTTLYVPTDETSRLWEDRLEALVLGAGGQRVELKGHVFDLSIATGRTGLLATLESVAASTRGNREALLQELSAHLDVAPVSPDDDRDRLSWEELRALKAQGLELGSHADLHIPLTRRPLAEATDGLRRSLAALRLRLGVEQPSLSYPYGARTAALVAAAKAAGFSCAVTGVPALLTHGADPFQLPRFLIGADDDRRRLRASLAGLRRFWQRDPWPAAPGFESPQV